MRMLRKTLKLIAVLIVTPMVILLPASMIISLPGNARAQAFDCSCLAPVIQLLQDILAQDTITATSVSTPGPAIFDSQAQFLNSLMQIMEGGVYTADAMLALYPGWVDPGPNAAAAAQNITIQTMQTYAGGIAVAQSQASDLQLQDAKLTTLQEAQLHRQLDITRLIVDTVHDAEELNERSGAAAMSQSSLMTAAQH
jgi:hypothetical protein